MSSKKSSKSKSKSKSKSHSTRGPGGQFAPRAGGGGAAASALARATVGVSFDQALAFVQVLIKASPVKAHLQAVLGLSKVAGIDDFTTHDADAQDRAAALIGYLRAVSVELDDRLKDQPRQLEMVRMSDGGSEDADSDEDLDGGDEDSEASELEEPSAATAATA